MDETDDLSPYMQQLELFRRNDFTRDQMIQDLLARHGQLQQAYRDKCDDYNNERESRRMWQTKANNLGRDVATLNKANESNPFVFVIIDGDGAIFQEALLKKGAEGGAEAGYLLWTEIKNYVTEAYPEAAIEDWNIIVQVILNMDGLAKKLHSSGIIPYTSTERTLTEFGRGFGRAQPLFSFIDVGAGKESADHKIREMLRVMVRITQCKHIFFGPCHDNGYLPVLEPYKLDDKVASKFTLIETTPAEEGFKHLKFQRVIFKSVFMSEKLPDRFQRPSITSMPPPPPPSSTITIPTAAKPPTGPAHTNSANNGAPLRPAAAEPSSVASVASPTSSGPQTPVSSWSTLTRVSTAPKPIDIFSTKKAPQPKYYLLNADSQRIDEPLPKVDPMIEKRFNARMTETGKKFCNNYHLHGECKNPNCTYIHGDKLSASELVLLKQKSRGIPCSMGSECDDISCTLGHHCRWLKDCNHNYCRFQGYHDISPKPRVKVFEDGSMKIIDKL
ncbi:C-x8-C-x5-C-x3-H type zinc finger protein [Colletotrichum orchidophilum]|uniref:C-x8-C-x5-C-x3-H type zinc finger protein n=1 Tax=Colletotrichum orchidophilum TaxID=1209926 RepID=A0A1G4BR14_9PEZI|nr:C-x8-C-x5-C-x3-H type zinc finger protein [Colletotrichum orchidophilum]OHF03726.1 C-x8-C-x5-C-x3-H type zinc finger protein [Colletotrichum orchidophilum]